MKYRKTIIDSSINDLIFLTLIFMTLFSIPWVPPMRCHLQGCQKLSLRPLQHVLLDRFQKMSFRPLGTKDHFWTSNLRILLQLKPWHFEFFQEIILQNDLDINYGAFGGF